ncbi:MAG: hypothetical protein IJJ41_08585 [Clostridia bacterium]|nr:hypothetical protein [Clostridia bacterium]
MKIERNNVAVEVNRPAINFDPEVMEQVEKKQVNKAKALLVATVVFAAVTTLYSNVRKVRKKFKKK